MLNKSYFIATRLRHNATKIQTALEKSDRSVLNKNKYHFMKTRSDHKNILFNLKLI